MTIDYETNWNSDKLEIVATDPINCKEMGIFECEKRDDSEDGKPYIMINNLNVDREYRCKGIAIKMFEKAFHECKQKGMKKFVLYVHKNNSQAISLYKKLGFRELRGKNKGYYEKIL